MKQILDAFRRFAEKIHAKGVLWRTDGTLTIAFDDGEVYHCSADNRFLTLVTGETMRHEEVLREALQQAERQTHDINPFLPKPKDKKTIELSRWLIKANMTAFFEEKHSRFGDFVLDDLYENEEGNAVFMRFFSQRREIVFRLFRSSPDNKSFPLAFEIIRDNRSEAEKKKASFLVENYLSFALKRSIGDSWKVLSTGEESKQKEEDKRPQEENGFLGGGDSYIDNGRTLDLRDEIPPLVFFYDKRMPGAMDSLDALAEAGDETALVLYSYDACAKLPMVGSVENETSNWHRLYPFQFNIHEKLKTKATDLSEIDLVMGDEEELKHGLAETFKKKEVRFIALFSTCIANFIGTDIHGIIKEASEGRDIPVAIMRTNLDDERTDNPLWNELFTFVKRDVEPRENVINLIGFAPSKHRIADELSSVFSAMGIEINGFIMPYFCMEAIERFHEARISVVNSDKLVQEAFYPAVKPLENLNTLNTPPPFGLAASMHFFGKTLEALPKHRAVISPEAYWHTFFAKQWNAWQARASEHRVAVVVDSLSFRNLLEPERFFGLDVVGVLAEMGFQVGIFIHGETKQEANQLHKHLSQRIQSRLGRMNNIAYFPKHCKTLVQCLSGFDGSLLISEFHPDYRASELGMQSISPKHFEMGFHGALRTLRRFVRMAESGYFAWGKTMVIGRER